MNTQKYLNQIQEKHGVIKLAWNPNTESILAGYKIHYGRSSRKYDQSIDVGNPINKEINQCETVLNLKPGVKYFIAATSYDYNNNESPYSSEVVTSLTTDLQEVDIYDPMFAIGLGAIVATGLILKDLIFFFIFVAQIAAQTKVDKKLTDKLNPIIKNLGVKKDFQVHVVPQKQPNAFTPGGKHVYITSGLLKILNERETLAVLLHEVYHAIDLHIVKRMATEFPLYYIAAPIAIAAAVASGPLALITGLLVFTIMMAILTLPLKITLGRKHEYDADNYAVKADYGKEIASALNKLERAYIKATQGQSCGKVCQVVNRIEEAMDEHPATRDRIERALKNAELLKAVAKANISAVTMKVKSLFSKGN